MRFLFGAVLACTAAPARAAEAALPSAGGLAQALLGLIAVLAMIGAAAWLLRRLGRSGLGAGRIVRTVAAAALGPRERVVVIEVGGVWLVAGVTAHNVSLLHTLPKGELPAAEAHAGGGFAALLERARGALERKP